MTPALWVTLVGFIACVAVGFGGAVIIDRFQHGCWRWQQPTAPVTHRPQHRERK